MFHISLDVLLPFKLTFTYCWSCFSSHFLVSIRSLTRPSSVHSVTFPPFEARRQSTTTGCTHGPESPCCGHGLPLSHPASSPCGRINAVKPLSQPFAGRRGSAMFIHSAHSARVCVQEVCSWTSECSVSAFREFRVFSECIMWACVSASVFCVPDGERCDSRHPVCHLTRR